MADIAELLAQLHKSNASSPAPARPGVSRPSESQSRQPSGYQPPTVSSPIASPLPTGGRPRHPEHILSAAASPLSGTPAPSDAARHAQSNSLLDILKAGASRPASEAQSGPARPSESATPLSASDLVASFARHGPAFSRGNEGQATSRIASTHVAQNAASPSLNPQDMLLTLLRRSESVEQGAGTDREQRQSSDALERSSAALAASSKSPYVQNTWGEAGHIHQNGDSLAPSSSQASAPSSKVPVSSDSHLSPIDGQELKNAVQEAAAEISEELRDGKTRHEVEEQISIPITEALKAVADATANDDVADNWETAESDETAKVDGIGHTVQVFNLPMRPFVSLEVNGTAPPPSVVRPDVIMKIASLKKGFDQVDRTLATASQNHIVYAIAKGGGFRVIRQDDGSNKTAYRQPENQIFNMSINSAPDSDAETVLATAVNGEVFWTSVSAKSDIAVDDLEKRSLVFPPPPSPDENTSTSQLKTRAKKSSRHPAFFAYGRSKTIYLVWPIVAQSDQYMDSKTRVVDSVKYLNDRCVRIATGKAGKDFTFSEDDTVLASLDKHGKLKFWDISDHIHPEMEYRVQSHVPHEVKEPVMTLFAASNSSKAWPTSVHFVDKERPTTKGLALRYMLVGLKQNHTIQLWDLGLGKAVQELNLPHGSETDAICSISYHSKSGIIAVGHPTRNSLYLIHLSAPKYNLPQLSQAKYMTALANNSKALPRPDSTAIMSGMREVSLSTVGSLRSIDVISPSPPTGEDREPDEDTVFEVYMMHSKGVTCLSFKRRDLGWGRDGKVVDARDAEREGIVTVSELQVRQPADGGDQSDVPAKSSVPGAKVVAKAAPVKPELKTDVEPATPKAVVTSLPVRTVTVEKTEKPKKKRSEDGEQSVKGSVERENDAKASALGPIADGDIGTQRTVDIQQAPVPLAAPLAGIEANTFESLANAERSLSAEQGTLGGQSSYAEALSEQMQNLYRRIDQDRRVMDAAGSARHEAVLRLVSSTLTDNVEKSLSSIVSESIKTTVLPSITQTASSTIDQKVGQVMSQQLGQALPRELRAILPDAVGKALQTPAMLESIASAVSSKVSAAIEKTLLASLQGQVSAALASVASEASAGTMQHMQKRLGEQTLLSQQQQQQDNAKIDQLSQAIGEMTVTLTSMATIQAELQREMRQLREQSGWRSETQGSRVVAAAEPANPELEAIVVDVEQGRVEQGTIRWLQSSNPENIFRAYFRKIDPMFLHGLSQIVVLSVAAAVTSTMGDSYLGERLSWLEVSLATVDAQSLEIASFAPKMMDILIGRLSDEYMRLSDQGMTSPAVLSRIHTLVRRAKEIKAATAAE